MSSISDFDIFGSSNTTIKSNNNVTHSYRLYVCYLPKSVTNDTITKLFKPYGTVDNIYITHNKHIDYNVAYIDINTMFNINTLLNKCNKIKINNNDNNIYIKVELAKQDYNSKLQQLWKEQTDIQQVLLNQIQQNQNNNNNQDMPLNNDNVYKQRVQTVINDGNNNTMTKKRKIIEIKPGTTNKHITSVKVEQFVSDINKNKFIKQQQQIQHTATAANVVTNNNYNNDDNYIPSIMDDILGIKNSIQNPAISDNNKDTNIDNIQHIDTNNDNATLHNNDNQTVDNISIDESYPDQYTNAESDTATQNDSMKDTIDIEHNSLPTNNNVTPNNHSISNVKQRLSLFDSDSDNNDQDNNDNNTTTDQSRFEYIAGLTSSENIRLQQSYNNDQRFKMTSKLFGNSDSDSNDDNDNNNNNSLSLAQTHNSKNTTDDIESDTIESEKLQSLNILANILSNDKLMRYKNAEGDEYSDNDINDNDNTQTTDITDSNNTTKLNTTTKQQQQPSQASDITKAVITSMLDTKHNRIMWSTPLVYDPSKPNNDLLRVDDMIDDVIMSSNNNDDDTEIKQQHDQSTNSTTATHVQPIEYIRPNTVKSVFRFSDMFKQQQSNEHSNNIDNTQHAESVPSDDIANKPQRSRIQSTVIRRVRRQYNIVGHSLQISW